MVCSENHIKKSCFLKTRISYHPGFFLRAYTTCFGIICANITKIATLQKCKAIKVGNFHF
jgi:hypothetical protein